jgi:hypothetical protein
MPSPSTQRDMNRSPRRDRIVRAAKPRVRVGQLEARRPDIEIAGMLLGASLVAVLAAVLRLA